MREKKILYACCGMGCKDYDAYPEGCYINAGDCRHTSDERYRHPAAPPLYIEDRAGNLWQYADTKRPWKVPIEDGMVYDGNEKEGK